MNQKFEYYQRQVLVFQIILTVNYAQVHSELMKGWRTMCIDFMLLKHKISQRQVLDFIGFTCKVCTNMFNSLGASKNRIYCYHASEFWTSFGTSYEFLCGFCTVPFRFGEELWKEMSIAIMHTNLKCYQRQICHFNDFVCELCINIFWVVTRMKSHTFCIHASETCFKCKVCVYRFSSLSVLKNHIYCNHGLYMNLFGLMHSLGSWVFLATVHSLLGLWSYSSYSSFCFEWRPCNIFRIDQTCMLLVLSSEIDNLKQNQCSFHIPRD